QAWIGEVLEIYQRHFELPLLSRLYQAWQAQDLQAVKTWNEFYLAGRDTAEAHAETRQMGYSLVRLLSGLDEVPADFMRQIETIETPSFPAVYAGVACLWRIPEAPSIQAFAWSWVENQVGAAMKAVPLGQLAGQRMLLSLGGRLPSLVSHAMGMADDEISNSCPALSIAGCRHETQYSRLFRS
ncbi:MAG TPA: urease accessory UreF family protein, partial [Methylophilaceae bacterium]|nr:urease accessory UreF family protein [Methylophilaceae bacterium]